MRNGELRAMSALLVLVVTVILVRSAGALKVPSGEAAWHWGAALILCAGCYLLSHVVRAARLAVVSGQMLGVSLRSAALAHLFVAPWSIILPFKLDEVLRWRELVRLGHHPVRALIVCLIDRTADGIVLLSLLVALFERGNIGTDRVVVMLLGVAIGLSVVCFILAPSMLEMLQQYLFENNFGVHSVRLLELVHHVRIELAQGRDTILRTLPWLLACTIVAWSLELSAVVVALGLGFGERLMARPSILLLLHRTGRSASLLIGLDTASGGPEQMLTVVFLAVLALAWVAVAPVYRRRWPREPRHRPGISATLPSPFTVMGRNRQ